MVMGDFIGGDNYIGINDFGWLSFKMGIYSLILGEGILNLLGNVVCIEVLF